MRVLVACEYSGTVRDAFSIKGYDAWSCDLLPTESELTASEGKHIQGDVLPVLLDGWDLLIGHPPCTYLSYAAMHVWNEPGRIQKRLDALDFFRQLYEAPIPRICLENPKGCASPTIAKYSQEIQPYYFGDDGVKTTWLWLKGLPLLQHSKTQTLFGEASAIEKPEPLSILPNGKKLYFSDAMKGGKDRAKNRAKFWPGIAAAMVEQWG